MRCRLCSSGRRTTNDELSAAAAAAESLCLGENYLAKETAIKQPPQSSSSACSRLLFMQNSTNSLQTAHTITAAHVQHRCRVVLF